MSKLININRGFEAMLPEPKDPEREEVTIKKNELAVEFTIFKWRFKLSLSFLRE